MELLSDRCGQIRLLEVVGKGLKDVEEISRRISKALVHPPADGLSWSDEGFSDFLLRHRFEGILRD